jgi:hypothetical protein
MYYFAVGSGYYEDECGEGAGERSETVGTGRPSRWVTKVHKPYCKQILNVLLPIWMEMTIDNGDVLIDIEFIYWFRVL